MDIRKVKRKLGLHNAKSNSEKNNHSHQGCWEQTLTMPRLVLVVLLLKLRSTKLRQPENIKNVTTIELHKLSEEGRVLHLVYSEGNQQQLRGYPSVILIDLNISSHIQPVDELS